MRIAVLSGKGGTGKTLVSVNLAAAAGSSTYIDCDVEEPNGHLFFKPKAVQVEEITVGIPAVDNTLCNGCRKCVDFCKFNALAYVKDSLIIFEEICHSCGGCMMFCPVEALKETEKVIGTVENGMSDQVRVQTGILNPGEVSGVPIIKRLIGESNPESKEELTLIDCPPGSACVVMESIKDADYCILVAEPTLFGAHNLDMVHELVELFQKPFGVVLNKCIEGENPSEEYCVEKGIRILGRIPYDAELGKLNSNGEIAARESEKYNAIFSSLLKTVRQEVQHETASDS